MSLATNPISLAQMLNKALLGQLATMLQYASFGNVLRQQVPSTLRRCNPVAAAAIAANPFIVAGQGVAEVVPAPSGGVISALGSSYVGCQLPDDAKCNSVLRATALTGTGTPGSLVVDLQATNDTNFASAGTGPAAGHIGVSPSGDIVTNATDAWTSLDVVYQPEKVDVVEYNPLSVVAATGICALPPAVTTASVGSYPVGVVMLMEAQALAGTVTGNCAVITPRT